MHDNIAMKESKLGTIKRRSPSKVESIERRGLGETVTFKRSDGSGSVLFLKTGRTVDARPDQLNGWTDWIPAENNFEDYNENGERL